MSSGVPIVIPPGIDQDVPVALLDENGNPVTVFTTADSPYAEVWSGENTPVILSPACTWISAPLGTFVMSFNSSDTADIAPGKYRLRYGVVSNGRTYAAQDVFLQFTESPGDATPLTSYCSYRDMVDFAPWIADLQDANDQTAFAVERYRARQWLDRVIQRHNPMSFWNEFAIPLFGFSIGTGNDLPQWNWGQTDPVLQAWLNQDLLLVSEQVTQITAKYALYLVCAAQVGPGSEKTNWQQLAADFYADAVRITQCYSAEIYLAGNPIAPIRVIPCSRVCLR
jgi:hypothetical protein